MDAMQTDEMVREHEAWAAVQARDALADGRFVFAVVTTGVYCRPSCPARRPLRANVRFFGDADLAEADGFRPCKRCRPRATLAPKAAMARRACNLIEKAAARGERLSLEALGDALGVTPWHAQRMFKAAIGVSPAEYARGLRAASLRASLGAGADVLRATFDAGFGSPSRLYEAAGAELGMTPASWRKGGLGERVTWTTAASPIGRVLVAATARGVCAVRSGDSEAILVEELRRELPRASIDRDDGAMRAWVDEIVLRASGQAPAASLPVDVRATGFTRAVWRALCAIPRGETRTYGEIATALGRPGAARAVAQACASNGLAVIVPCHRVVPATGGAPSHRSSEVAVRRDVGGYRWGARRKASLLARER